MFALMYYIFKCKFLDSTLCSVETVHTCVVHVALGGCLSVIIPALEIPLKAGKWQRLSFLEQRTVNKQYKSAAKVDYHVHNLPQLAKFMLALSGPTLPQQ